MWVLSADWLKNERYKIILYLHRALNKVTQSANQHMHTFNFFFIY